MICNGNSALQSPKIMSDSIILVAPKHNNICCSQNAGPWGPELLRTGLREISSQMSGEHNGLCCATGVCVNSVAVCDWS